MNILICYTPKTELRMQCYEAMNMSTWIWKFGDLVKIYPAEKVNGRRGYPGRSSAGTGEGVWIGDRWIWS